MKRIGIRLWFGSTMLVLFIIAMVWIFQIVLLRNFYIEERKDALLENGSALAYELRLWDQEGDAPVAASQITAMLFTAYDTRVAVLDANDKILMNDTLAPPEMTGNRLREFVEENKPLNIDLIHIYERAIGRSKTTVTYSLLEDKFPPNGAMMVTTPIILGNTYKGKVVLFMPLAPIDESATILQKQLTLISIASLLLGSLFALAMSRQFTKPILNIREATHQIAGGNFDVSLQTKSKDELGLLTQDIQFMARRLEELDQERKDFIANASHDLRTPITLIQTYSEFLIEKNDTLSEDDLSSIQVIHDEAQRLGNIVEDLLYLTRIESRGARLNCHFYSLSEITHEILKSYFKLTDTTKLSFKVHIIGPEKKVYLDKQKIQRVIYNLVDNIQTHAYGATQMDIMISYTPQGFRFEITDNGCGISDEDLEYVWDRFYKGDKSRMSQTKDSSSQSGIGMAIIKQILHMHQYEHGIDSEVGVGTTVWFNGVYQ